MSENTRFNLIICCLMALASLFGVLAGRNHERTQTNLSSFTEKNNALQAHTLAGVSFADSVAFQLAAEQCTEIDFPEEQPDDGDEMCAYICGDTIFVEYWHGFGSQVGRFRYRYGE